MEDRISACAKRGYSYAIRDFPGRIVALHNGYWGLEGALESESAENRRTFFRFSFWANLLLRRFLSPGFRKNACFLTSLIMPSCCTCRLNRRRALSIDSPSKIRIAANACLLDLADHPNLFLPSTSSLKIARCGPSLRMGLPRDSMPQRSHSSPDSGENRREESSAGCLLSDCQP